MKDKKVQFITRAGLISALYVALVFPSFSFASGFFQLRFCEALTVLPLFFIEAVPGLFIGCIIVNLITGCALIDIILGALITLVASLLTFVVGKIIKNTVLKFIVGGFFPIVLNAFLLPLIWYLAYGKLEIVYIYNVISLLISQSVSIYLFGIIVLISVKKLMKTK